MQIAHLGRWLYVSANPRACEIAPVTVIAGTNVHNDKIAIPYDSVRRKAAIRSGVRTGADNVGALRPLTAHRGHGFPCDREDFTLLYSGTQSLDRAIQRRLGNRVRDLQADNFVLRLNFLRAHEHALIAVG